MLNTNAYNGPAVSANLPPINEPTMLGVASEILNHCATAEIHLAKYRSGVFGEGESAHPEQIPPSSLDGMLRQASTRVALICGQLATINGRTGVAE